MNSDKCVKKYLRPAQYAQEHSVSLRTLKTWMYNRVVPYIKLGRVVLIDPREADEALQKFKRTSVP